MKSDIETLREQINDIKIAMLTTVDDDGSLRSRPMGTQDLEFDGELWFFVSDTSPKVQEIRHEQQVNVSYADPGSNRYVSVSGRGVIVHDKAKMEQFWNPFLKAWFPDGLESPDIALLKIMVDKAEYWDYTSGKLVQLIGFIKAAVTGEPSDLGGKNEKLTIN